MTSPMVNSSKFVVFPGTQPQLSGNSTRQKLPAPPLERSRVVVPDRAQSCRAESFLRQQLKHLENCAHRDDSPLAMKSILISIVACVVLVGCVPKQLQKTKAIPIQQAVPPTAKAPDISIYEAAYEGGIEAVKQHLEAGVNVNAKNQRGLTPLHAAAVNGHKEVTELLIDKSADVNAKTKRGDTPLDWAIHRKHTETADLLRKHGGKTAEELKAEGK